MNRARIRCGAPRLDEAPCRRFVSQVGQRCGVHAEYDTRPTVEQEVADLLRDYMPDAGGVGNAASMLVRQFEIKRRHG